MHTFLQSWSSYFLKVIKLQLLIPFFKFNSITLFNFIYITDLIYVILLLKTAILQYYPNHHSIHHC